MVACDGKPCDPGQESFWGQTSQKKCENCAVGTFAALPGSSECTSFSSYSHSYSFSLTSHVLYVLHFSFLLLRFRRFSVWEQCRGADQECIVHGMRRWQSSRRKCRMQFSWRRARMWHWLSRRSNKVRPPFPPSTVPLQPWTHSSLHCATLSIQSIAANCTSCETGKFASTVSTSTTCMDCGLGHFASMRGQSFCNKCEPEHVTFLNYQATNCTKCSIGRFSNEAAIECLACPSNTYRPFGSGYVCTSCPKFGVDCIDGVLSIRNEYWLPLPRDNMTAIQEDTTLYPCLNEKACDARNLQRQPTVRCKSENGYTGAICGESRSSSLCCSFSLALIALSFSLSPSSSFQVGAMSMAPTIFAAADSVLSVPRAGSLSQPRLRCLSHCCLRRCSTSLNTTSRQRTKQIKRASRVK